MQIKKYQRPMTDENIRSVFRDAADFIARELRCGEHTVYAYAIDGLIASATASDFIFKPIVELLRADCIEQLYQKAQKGMIYNNVAVPCKDLNQILAICIDQP